MTILEFWPDYGPGPLWSKQGHVVDLAALGLSQTLVEEVSAWNAEYAEDKVPLEGPGDETWLRQGREILYRLRNVLGAEYRVEVTEPWWGEEPT